MNLPPEWIEISAEEALGLENELAREVCSEHILANVPAKCIARRDGRDDFLFRVTSDNAAYAVVHLTWSKESSPDWPWAKLFSDIDDFKSNWRRILD